MLLHRVLTALFLEGLLLTLLFAFTHLRWFEIVLSCVFLLMMWEWNNIAGIKNYVARVAYTCTVFAIAAVLCFPVAKPQFFWVFPSLSLLAWLYYLGWFFSYPKMISWKFMPVRLVVGVLGLAFPMYCFCIITNSGLPHGSWLIFAPIMVVAAMDVGSYFSGQWWGATPLAAHISPKKTIGGLIGGTITSLCVALVFAWGWVHYTENLAEAVYLFLALLVTLPFAVGGDLLISMFKRYSGIKDTGNILPGHGGMLDRLDGVIAALPPYVLVLLTSGLV